MDFDAASTVSGSTAGHSRAGLFQPQRFIDLKIAQDKQQQNKLASGRQADVALLGLFSSEDPAKEANMWQPL